MARALLLSALVLAKVRSAAVFGCEALDVFVEVDSATGLPCFLVVGLGSSVVKEAGVRVRAALEHSGWKLPPRKLVVNLAPADLRKDGASFDLPIAVGVLAAQRVVQPESLEGLLFVGELSLDGRVRPIAGAISIALHARDCGIAALVLPRESAAQAACVDGIAVLGADSLTEVVAHLNGQAALLPARAADASPHFANGLDLADVQGLEYARLALEVAAAGGHNLLYVGAPGAGKSMLAQRLPSIVPPLSRAEALETSMIYSASGLAADFVAGSARPFRAPHHDASTPALVGGGSMPRPGEISLAHNGVLFLDELPEFARGTLQALRQPIEEGKITVVRANGVARFPARFSLVGAMNPCACGYFGATRRACVCDLAGMRRYRARISGPLLDRFDLQVYVPSVDATQLTNGVGTTAESSAVVRDRVLAARERQVARLAPFGLHSNAQIPSPRIEELCLVDSATLMPFARVLEQRAVSARGLFRMVKVARTLADLDGAERVGRRHLATAIEFRALDYEA